jgi:hypothetical protein
LTEQYQIPARIRDLLFATLLLGCGGLFASDGAPSDDSDQDHEDHKDHGHSLGLSDEVVSFEEYAQDIAPRQATLTEAIDDAVYPENKARKELLDSRADNDVTTEIPERKSLFGQDRFLSPGPIDPGFESPTGATWRPSFVSFGTFRTAIQSYEAAGGPRTTEWANRLDIFGNFSLTSTERFLFGFRPLDEEGDFTGFQRRQGGKVQSTNGFDGEPHTFFIEGYLDELFPRFDPDDRMGLDIGYSLGRQPLFLQDGILANDDVDAVGFTKHNFFRMNASATRLSAFVAFNEVHRDDNRRDSGSTLYALSSTLDYPKRTLEVDAAYVDGSSASGGDGFYFGVGHIARFGYWNSTFRINTSVALDQGSNAVDDGWLFTHQLSRTMRHSDDILTFGMYAEIDNYTSAARGPATGGALGGFSLLQRAVGIGSYGAPIGMSDREALGFEVSYQHFLDSEERRQILLSAGVSRSHNALGNDTETGAVALQYQQALSRNLIWSTGGFGSITDEGERGFGVRSELIRKF